MPSRPVRFAGLAAKRDELRAKGIEVTDIVDHGWAQSIYFRDPNGLSLEYCCVVRNPSEIIAAMQGHFTVPRAALDLNNALNESRSALDQREAEEGSR